MMGNDSMAGGGMAGECAVDSAAIAAGRRKALCAEVRGLGLDAYYCRSTSDIRWATSFDAVFDTEAAHLMLVSGDDAVVHTDSRYTEAMLGHPSRGGLEISEERVSHAEFAARRLSGLADPSGEGGAIRIGVEPSITLSEYRALEDALSAKGLSFEIEMTADPVDGLRRVKDATEIAYLERAQQITDQAFSELLGWVHAGMTEKELANELEYSMRKLGATGIAFSTIAASGPHSSMPHAVPTDKELQPGEFVVIDFGARYGDYCADMTRTIAIGEPSQEMRRIYDTVLDAQTQCKQAIREGVENRSVHELAESIISDAGYAGRFTHSLGHGVGIDIHETPNLSPKSPDVLTAGNVVTVEPGIYVPGVAGVRIEDYGVVTADGFDAFTQSPHELQIVG